MVVNLFTKVISLFPFKLHLRKSSSNMPDDLILAVCNEFIPKLSPKLHKGSNGRIGVIGGSLEYTGAPYFAAISALKVGADLVHVFCSKTAAPVIKGYSPELIVHPLLDVERPIEEISPWLERLHSLVIGPGLGRNEEILSTVKSVIDECRKRPIPLIIDADGLHLLTTCVDLLTGYDGPVILTPNRIEYQRLASALGTPEMTVLEMSRKLGCVVLQKGETDMIANGRGIDGETACNTEPGSWRRSGGQGDVLAGTVSVFAAWQSMTHALTHKLGFGVAAYGAAALTRRCSHLAFAKYRRSMTASNLIEFIQPAFEELFEN